MTACFEEGSEVFLAGLRDVVEAQGGIARAAEASKLNRESLYRLVSRSDETTVAVRLQPTDPVGRGTPRRVSDA